MAEFRYGLNKKVFTETGALDRMLSVDQKGRYVSWTEHVPDLKWRGKCACGRVHRFGTAGQNHALLSLRVVIETYWCRDCQDEHEDRRRECIKCGGEIRPKYKEEKRSGWMPSEPNGQFWFVSTRSFDELRPMLWEPDSVDLAAHFPEILSKGRGFITDIQAEFSYEGTKCEVNGIVNMASIEFASVSKST